MATNQVNIVNLLSLPKAQTLLPGNYLIVQNGLGTQLIDWTDVAVLKLDDLGGATITSLTATNLVAGTVISSFLSASNYYSEGQTGTLSPSGYYNVFTVTNGLVTQADYLIGSPEYQDIISTQLPAVTSSLAGIFKKLYIDYQTASSTASSFSFQFPNPFSEISSAWVNDVQPVDIQWTCTPTITCVPQFSTSFNGGKLDVVVDLDYLPTTSISYGFKIIREY